MMKLPLSGDTLLVRKESCLCPFRAQQLQHWHAHSHELAAPDNDTSFVETGLGSESTMKSMEKLCQQLALRDRTAGKRRWPGTVMLAAHTGIFSCSDHVDHDPHAPSELDSKTLYDWLMVNFKKVCSMPVALDCHPRFCPWLLDHLWICLSAS